MQDPGNIYRPDGNYYNDAFKFAAMTELYLYVMEATIKDYTDTVPQWTVTLNKLYRLNF